MKHSAWARINPPKVRRGESELGVTLRTASKGAQSTSGKKRRMQRLLYLAAAFVMLQPSVAAASSCFKLDGESYCQAWSASDASVSKREFLRAGESVNRWQNMVTILQYKRLSSIRQAIPHYFSVIRPYLGNDARPQWIAPKNSVHKEAMATRLVLSTPDNSESEYVVAYFFSDGRKPAYAIIFSQHIPLPYGTPTMAQYGRWLDDMQAIRP